MLFLRRPSGEESFVLAMIKARRVGRKFCAPSAALDKAVAAKIQAKLHATRMKTRGPIQFAFRKKVVPLHAETCAAKTAKQRLPAADIAPSSLLGEGGNRLCILRIAVGRGGHFVFYPGNSQLGSAFWQVVKTEVDDVVRKFSFLRRLFYGIVT